MCCVCLAAEPTNDVSFKFTNTNIVYNEPGYYLWPDTNVPILTVIGKNTNDWFEFYTKQTNWDWKPTNAYLKVSARPIVTQIDSNHWRIDFGTNK